MRALMLDRYGPPGVLHLAHRPTPEAAPGQVLVRVLFSGVNPIDLGVRAGRVLPGEPGRFPMVLGWDGAGVVEALGEGSTGLAPGDRVMANSKQPSSGIGLHAEYAALPADQIVRLPEGTALETAAATPLAAVTALNAVEALALPPGARLHVNNPAGAVGRFAVQIARALGIEVIGAPSPGGVEGAIDVRGGTAAHAAFAAVRDGGAYATVIPEWWEPGGVYAPARGIRPFVVENAPTHARLVRLATWLAEGRIAPEIEAVLPLGEGAEAHRRLEAPSLTRALPSCSGMGCARRAAEWPWRSRWQLGASLLPPDLKRLVAQAQVEDMVKPNGVADDLGWEAKAEVGGAVGRHHASFAQACHSGQRPTTWQCLPAPSRTAKRTSWREF